MTIGKLSNATAAVVTTGNETYNIVAGQTLNLVVNGPNQAIASYSSPLYGGLLVSIAFAASMAANLAAMTKTELAAALNAAFAAQANPGQPPPAVAAVSGSAVTITSARLGNQATIQILPDSTAALLTTLGLTAGITLGTGLPGHGAQPSAPTFFSLLSFTGDTAYPTNGTAGFGAAVKALYGDQRTVLAVIGQDCGGYFPVYDPVADKLKVYWCAGNGAPATEVTNATNLSGTTFKVLVIAA